MEHDVFSADILSRLSRKGHFDGGGNLEPGKTGGHAGGHIGGAHTGGECAQGAIGTGVGVGSGDDLTGGGQPLLGD